MKTLAAIMILLALSVTGVSAQTHAPLPEQCRADIHLWRSEADDKNAVDLSFDELTRRTGEIADCLVVDTGEGQSSSDHDADVINYLGMAAAYHTKISTKLVQFIISHHLYQQFRKEDIAGR